MQTSELGFLSFAMASTGEADRKRRHFSSIPPTVSMPKKQPLLPVSEEKKLDAAVLRFQNQKLLQKLEIQKIECKSAEDKLGQLRDKQSSYDRTLAVVNSSLEELVDELVQRSNHILDNVKHVEGFDGHQLEVDGDSPPEYALLSRLLETGATESSSTCTINTSTEEVSEVNGVMTKEKVILRNILSSLDHLNDIKRSCYAGSLKALSSSGHNLEMLRPELQTKVNNLKIEALKLHLKHKSLMSDLQKQRDTDAKNKAELMCLKGELESAIAELEESNRELAILKVERERDKVAILPALSPGSKQLSGDKLRDKESDLHDMESTLKELLDVSTSQLHELKRLHEDRLGLLQRLSDLQSNLRSFKGLCSSRAYSLLKDQLAKAKADVAQYQVLYENLQIEKDNLFWREKEIHIKSEISDAVHRSSAVIDSRISDLKSEISRYKKEKDHIEFKLIEASKERGRKDIIREFKALASSFPEKMSSMQSQIAKHKETAANIHHLRAEVCSLTNILADKDEELRSLTFRSDQHDAEILKLRDMVHDLKETEKELNLFLEMYLGQSVDSRELGEARRCELKAWARVQSLKSSLDEHVLEARVKAAIEDEANSQQRLAASEAEIADLRRRLDASKREKLQLSDVLKSKSEETDAYLAEIETIGQAYDEMQTQNQQLLLQIAERDDYNLKLVLEGVRARQKLDVLAMEKHMSEKAVHQTRKTVELYAFKANRIEDQLKAYKEHSQRLSEDRTRNVASRENTEKALLEGKRSLQKTMGMLEESQSQAEKSWAILAERQIELEKERFERKRVEEDLEALRRKADHLKLQYEGSMAEKLRADLKEYTEILKCSVCHDRRKEVVITKCYHLSCNPCIQRLIERRNRRCPVCSVSFGVNDVKPIYI